MTCHGPRWNASSVVSRVIETSWLPDCARGSPEAGAQPDIISPTSLWSAASTPILRAALARSLVSFAADTDAELIAEGIETAAERSRLAELGLSYGQGFHLARPADLASPRSNPANQPDATPSHGPGR